MTVYFSVDATQGRTLELAFKHSLVTNPEHFGMLFFLPLCGFFWCVFFFQVECDVSANMEPKKREERS